MNTNLAAHVTSVFSGVGALLALIHPGFTIPTGVQALAITVCVTAATALQLYHQFSHRTFQTNLLAARSLADAVAAQANKPA